MDWIGPVSVLQQRIKGTTNVEIEDRDAADGTNSESPKLIQDVYCPSPVNRRWIDLQLIFKRCFSLAGSFWIAADPFSNTGQSEAFSLTVQNGTYQSNHFQNGLTLQKVRRQQIRRRAYDNHTDEHE